MKRSGARSVFKLSPKKPRIRKASVRCRCEDCWLCRSSGAPEVLQSWKKPSEIPDDFANRGKASHESDRYPSQSPLPHQRSANILRDYFGTFYAASGHLAPFRSAASDNARWCIGPASAETKRNVSRSGGDLNSRPPVSQTGALTELRTLRRWNQPLSSLCQQAQIGIAARLPPNS